MKMRANFLLLTLLITLAQGRAQSVYNGRVMDAETGEPIPYATLYISPGNGTLSNADGNFCLKAKEEDMVRVSCIGYNAQQVRGNLLGTPIKLLPLTKTMREVTVKPIPAEKILKQLIAKLKKEYKDNFQKRSNYFCRITVKDDSNAQILEAFLQACSNCNLNGLEIISGISHNIGEDGLNIAKTNVHKLMELSPRINMSETWTQVYQPLSSNSWLKKYDLSGTEYTDQDNHKIYKIDVTYKGRILNEADLFQRRADMPNMPMTGTIFERSYTFPTRAISGSVYVDAEKMELLSFEGKMVNHFMTWDGKRSVLDTNLHLDYSHENGFTEVQRLTVKGYSEGVLTLNGLAFLIEKEAVTIPHIDMGVNMMRAIEEAGTDSPLWDDYNIVKRTAEEEKIAFGTDEDAPKPIRRMMRLR